MIKNIIFDWAGVIINDFEPTYNSVIKVFEKLNLPKLTKEEFKKEFTIPIQDFYKKFLKNPNMEYIHQTFLEEIKKQPEPTIYSQVNETLKYLSNKNIKLIILSAHPQEKLLIEAKNYQIKKYFKIIAGSTHNKKEKLEQIIKENKFNKNETLYLGSNTNSIRTGKDNQIKTAISTWGYFPIEKLKAENPDYILNSIEELTKLLI